MGAHLLQNDPNFTTGKFFAFLLYANIFYEPVRQLVSINNLVSAGKASGERVFEILDEPIRIQNPPEPVSFPKSDCSIRFQSVSFSYGSRGNIVENLDFEIPNQSTTALVGPTSAGKSTIANLLLRYYDANSGSIRIGNAELRNLRLEDLRQNIGFVSQDPFLFDASIKENLLLADRSKGDSDLEKALHAACALDFVRKLPDHWNTVIGERGIRLSMGEKQRLTLARAILKSPSIIVLDEATSSVDVENRAVYSRRAFQSNQKTNYLDYRTQT